MSEGFNQDSQKAGIAANTPAAATECSPPRPVLRWHGGKWKLAPWIVSHFPKHSVYVEPYGGAGSVLMRKPRSYAEVWNDLDGEAVNMFRVLRSPRAQELVESLRLTPFSRSEFMSAYQTSIDPVERARRLIIRSFMGFGSNGHARSTGFRANSNRSGTTPAHDWINYPDSLEIFVMTAHDGPETLHYVDPPYVFSTRADLSKDYAVEMTDLEHIELLDHLGGLKGMVVLSGYPSDLYDSRLPSWRRVEREALADGALKRIEVLWLNPACAAALDFEQLPMFAHLESA